MLHSFIKASAALAFGAFTFVSPALAITPLPVESAATFVVPIQDYENQELERDLQTDEFEDQPEAAVGEDQPEAAVGNEGQAQAPKSWERATNQTDCESAAGLWDADANMCIEKKM